MRYLIDSSAWIEYLEGSSIGEEVHRVLESKEEVFILALNIAEVISKMKRKGKNYQVAYESMIKNSKVVEVTPKIAMEAGLLHSEIKPKNSSFSLADALIIKSAESISAKIITKDHHFKDFKESIILSK